MKRFPYAAVAAMAFVACGKEAAQTPSGNTSSDSSFAIHSPTSTVPKSYLTIHGNGIWVRSSPNDGEVVMKLNEGDRCEWISTDSALTLIKGNADYWQLITINGDTGWVFGSQTDQKLEPLGEGATAEEAWEDFLANRRAICEHFDSTLDKREYGGSSEATDLPDRGLKLQYGYDEDTFDTTFTFALDTIGPLWMLPVQTFYGAAMGCMESATVFGSHQAGWRMSRIVSGTVADQVQVDDETVLLALFYDKNCMIMGWQTVSIWAWSKKYKSLEQVQSIGLPFWEMEGNEETNEMEQADHVDGLEFVKEAGKLKLVFSNIKSGSTTMIWNRNTSQFE